MLCNLCSNLMLGKMLLNKFYGLFVCLLGYDRALRILKLFKQDNMLRDVCNQTRKVLRKDN